MDSLAIILVLTSACIHSFWNFLMRKSNNKTSFNYLFLITSLVVYSPFFFYMLFHSTFELKGWVFIILSGFIHFVYFVALTKAYAHGDLSVVYPLARSSLVFTPVLAFFFLNERISTTAVVGIFLITLGVYVLHLKSVSFGSLFSPFHNVKEKSFLYALLTAVSISFYSLVDKIGIGYVNPFVYIYLMFFFTVSFMTPYLFLSKNHNNIDKEWGLNKKSVVVSGIACLFTYMLVLFAFKLTKLSYVSSLRELSIIFAIAFGTKLLNEQYWRIRLTAAVIMCTGFFLIALSS